MAYELASEVTEHNLGPQSLYIVTNRQFNPSSQNAQPLIPTTQAVALNQITIEVSSNGEAADDSPVLLGGLISSPYPKFLTTALVPEAIQSAYAATSAGLDTLDRLKKEFFGAFLRQVLGFNPLEKPTSQIQPSTGSTQKLELYSPVVALLVFSYVEVHHFSSNQNRLLVLMRSLTGNDPNVVANAPFILGGENPRGIYCGETLFSTTEINKLATSTGRVVAGFTSSDKLEEVKAGILANQNIEDLLISQNNVGWHLTQNGAMRDMTEKEIAKLYAVGTAAYDTAVLVNSAVASIGFSGGLFFRKNEK
jgi:hypothetical protein